MKTLGILILPFLISSCAFHSGLITSSMNLSNNEKLEYSDIGIGYSKVSYIFGIGGLGKDATVNDAKRSLYFSYPLKSNQTYENLTIDFKTTMFWPYIKVETFAIADIVTRDTSIDIKYSQNYLDLVNSFNVKNVNNFRINETVILWDKTQFFKIIKLNKSSAVLLYIAENGTFQTTSINYSNIYKISDFDNDSKFVFKIGDKVKYEKANSSGEYDIIEGTIYGLNTNEALIQTSKGKSKVQLASLSKNN